MPTDFWAEDDRPPPRRKPWRWWQVAALGLIALVAVTGIAVALAPEQFANRWIGLQMRQLRNDILSGKLSAEALREELSKREGGHNLALRLSEDENPRVRAAAAGALTWWGRPAERRNVGDLRLTGNRFSDTDIEAAFQRLLDDPDPAVRKAAIRAVSSIEEVRSFKDQLLRILESGPADERLIVAESLAHWNGEVAIRTFGSPRQPKDVRLAAIKGADRFGWGEIVMNHAAFVQAMKRVQADPDPELREAATAALNHPPEENAK